VGGWVLSLRPFDSWENHGLGRKELNEKMGFRLETSWSTKEDCLFKGNINWSRPGALSGGARKGGRGKISHRGKAIFGSPCIHVIRDCNVTAKQDVERVAKKADGKAPRLSEQTSQVHRSLSAGPHICSSMPRKGEGRRGTLWKDSSTWDLLQNDRTSFDARTTRGSRGR